MTLLVKALIINILLCLFIALILYVTNREKEDGRKGFKILFNYLMVSTAAILIIMMIQWTIQ